MADDHTGGVSDLKFTKSEENTLAAQRYEIVRRIGEGSYAKVYLCKKIIDGKVSYTACKTINTAEAPREFVKKFLPREIEILLKVKHQYIIHVEYIFQRRAKYYILMRFAENKDLLEYILANPTVSESRARYWMSQIFRALRYLHDEENIVHRDIKCENILLTEHFNIRLCDFGFSKKMARTDELSKTFCGSRVYTAPEVLRGRPYNPMKYDIWSSGIVLLVMMNKKFPFNEQTNRKLVQKMLERKIAYRPKVEEILSEEFKEAIFCILEPDPKKRWTAEQCLQCRWILKDERIAKQNHPERREKSIGENIDKLMQQAQDNADALNSAMTVLTPANYTKLAPPSTFGPAIVDSQTLALQLDEYRGSLRKEDSTRSFDSREEQVYEFKLNEQNPQVDAPVTKKKLTS